MYLSGQNFWSVIIWHCLIFSSLKNSDCGALVQNAIRSSEKSSLRRWLSMHGVRATHPQWAGGIRQNPEWCVFPSRIYQSGTVICSVNLQAPACRHGLSLLATCWFKINLTMKYTLLGQFCHLMPSKVLQKCCLSFVCGLWHSQIVFMWCEIDLWLL